MVFAQSNLNVAILRPNDTGVVVNQIDAAGWQSNVIDQGGHFFFGNDFSNGFFYSGKSSR